MICGYRLAAPRSVRRRLRDPFARSGLLCERPATHEFAFRASGSVFMVGCVEHMRAMVSLLKGLNPDAHMRRL